jgi:hypothetical protein
VQRFLTRRALLALAWSAGLSFQLRGEMSAQRKQSTASALDHLLLGAADLDRGIEWLEKRTGVKAVIGGSHPGRGTRNALIALHGRKYVEVIAPDPAQPETLASHLRSITEPRLIGWAAASPDIEALGRRIRLEGLEATGPRDGSRARPDGRLLKWVTLGVASDFAAAGVDPIPFFIQWAADSAHPSTDSPKGCELSSLEFEHPDPEGLRSAFAKLGLDASVQHARAVNIVASLSTPKGRVVLR